MAGEFAVVFEVLLDNIYAFLFIEEEDDLPMHVFHGNINCPRSLNRCHGYFEQTAPFYIPLMNFKATSVRKEDSGHGRQLPVGNPFGRQVIGAQKQVSIFLWCIEVSQDSRRPVILRDCPQIMERAS